MNNEIIPTVGVLVFREECVLLVKHAKGAGHITGVYGLPAGRIDENESEREAAVRELEEESGLRVQASNLIELEKVWQATIETKYGTKDFSLKVFIAKTFEGSLKESEEGAPEWVLVEDLIQFNLLPNVQNVVNEGLKVIRENV